MHAAAFQEQYEAVTAFSTAGRGDASGYDPAELVRAAIAELAGDPELLRQERERARWLFVDEYQDTDPAQVELLDLLAGGGGNLVAVGDPDQAIYAFRGAEPRGIVEFPERFRHTDGRPAARVSLGVCRRSGAELLRISRQVAEGLPGPWEHRRLVAGRGHRPRQRRGARVRLGRGRGGLPGRPAAARPPARRRAVVADGGRRPRRTARSARCAARSARPASRWRSPPTTSRWPPSRRSRRCSAPSRRCCPTGRAAANARRRGSTSRRPRRCSPRRWAAPRCSTCAGCAGRSASSWPSRGIDAAERGAPLATVLADDGAARGAARSTSPGRPRRVAGVLAAGRVALAADGTAEDVLWAMWQRSGLAAQWARASAAGGPTGAAADRDLDAVVALFDAAAGFVDRLPSADVAGVRRRTCPPRSCPATPARRGRWPVRRCGC